MTWSLALVRAYSAAAVAVRGVLDACGRLEELTRPPRRPFADLDVEHDYTEPGLTGDELVGVRGLLQERYEPQTSPAASAAGESPSEVCGHPPVHPSEGRPTSELLTRAAVVIDISAAFASALGYCNEATGTQLDVFSAELRARAEVFRRVEDEGHDVGLSWAAETTERK